MHKRKNGRREARLRECLSVDSSNDGGCEINHALEESYSVEDEAIVDGEEGDDAAELRSCFRGGDGKKGHRRSVSWGKARVREVERLSQSDSIESVSFEDDPPLDEADVAEAPPPAPIAPTVPMQTIQEEVVSSEWPSKNDLAWYNLGYLKFLSEEAMEQMAKGKDAIRSSFSQSFSFDR